MRTLIRCLLAGWLILGLEACQGYFFEQQCAEAVREVTVEVATFIPTPADILFVIDNSGSMEEEQNNLERNFDQFIEIVSASIPDYRIAVVSTDLTSSGGETVGFRTYAVSSGGPYPVQTEQNRDGCIDIGVEHGCFHPMGPNRWLDSTSDTQQEIITRFGQTARVGTCGSGAEQGSNAMLEALRNTADGECNEGFLREEANLVIIFVTDEDDNQPSAAEAIVDELATFKPLEQIRLAVIGGFVLDFDGAGVAIDRRASVCRTGDNKLAIPTCGTSACNMGRPPANAEGSCSANSDCSTFKRCSSNTCVDAAWLGWDPTDPGFGCDSCSLIPAEDCCQSDDPADSYEALLNEFENRVTANSELVASRCLPTTTGNPSCLVDSICQEEFAETLRRIANDLVVISEIQLNPPASNPAGVRLRIDAETMTTNLVLGEDYTVSEDGTRVELISARAFPGQDEDLQVFFTAEPGDPAPPTGACD